MNSAGVVVEKVGLLLAALFFYSLKRFSISNSVSLRAILILFPRRQSTQPDAPIYPEAPIRYRQFFFSPDAPSIEETPLLPPFHPPPFPFPPPFRMMEQGLVVACPPLNLRIESVLLDPSAATELSLSIKSSPGPTRSVERDSVAPSYRPISCSINAPPVFLSLLLARRFFLVKYRAKFPCGPPLFLSRFLISFHPCGCPTVSLL